MVLDRQLETAARTFVGESRNSRVDPAKREVWLSAIFDFYTKDFLAHAPSLIAYVSCYRDEPVPGDFRLRFSDYEWTVKQTRAEGGIHRDESGFQVPSSSCAVTRRSAVGN